MWDQRKLVLAGIILAAALTVAGMTFVLVRANRTPAPQTGQVGDTQSKNPSTEVESTAQSGDLLGGLTTPEVGGDTRNDNSDIWTGNSVSGDIHASQGTPSPTPSLKPTPNSTESVAAPTPTSVELAVPGDPSFSAAAFKVTSQNDSAGVSNYLLRLASATSQFDLNKNFSAVQDGLQTAMQNHDTKYLQNISESALSMGAVVASVPVPFRVLGLAQNYYLSYARLHDLVIAAIQLIQSGQNNSQLEMQLESALDDFTSVADITTYDFLVAQTIAGQ